MPTFERSIEVAADRLALFQLTQDYNRRLEWDPFLKEATLVDGAEEAGKGVRAWCVATTGLGMETEYVSFRPPEVVAVKMTQGPAILSSFAGSWRFERVSHNRTRVTFRYHLKSNPGWLRPVLDPILQAVFERDVELRLEALKHRIESGVVAV